MRAFLTTWNFFPYHYSVIPYILNHPIPYNDRLINIFRMQGYRAGCSLVWVVRKNSFSGRWLVRGRSCGFRIRRCDRQPLSTPQGYLCIASTDDLCRGVCRSNDEERQRLRCALIRCLAWWRWLIFGLAFVLEASFRSFFVIAQWRAARWVFIRLQNLAISVGESVDEWPRLVA